MPPRMTVAVLNAEGVQGAWVRCLDMRCRNFSYLTWRRLRVDGGWLDKDLEFRLRLRCSLCGCTEVRVQPFLAQPPI